MKAELHPKGKFRFSASSPPYHFQTPFYFGGGGADTQKAARHLQSASWLALVECKATRIHNWLPLVNMLAPGTQ